ncbi:hypothetical protein ACOSQ2_006712 [Xanthoceras sorbifolium]
MGTRSRSLLRTLGRSLCTTAGPTNRNNNHHTHKYLDPNSFVGCWEAPRTPKEAEKRLAQLRREYAKQLKDTRKGYIHEMELLRLEKLRKDQATQEALRIANEERKKLKAEAAKVRAEERKLAQEEFRQTLFKERTEKLENWRMKEKLREEKKKEKSELLRRKSSMWVEESEMEKRLLDVAVATSAL